MKQTLKITIPILLLLAMFSCKNQEWEFPDYKFSGTYFAYQTPVRTLVLGDYEQVDNTKDNNLQFSIGATMGGVYENTKDIKVDFVVDNTLVNNLYNDKGEQILALPASYYTLSSPNTIVIPKDKLTGFVDVQLSDAFLNDPNSIKLKYVIPLKITSSETDSVLVGSTTKPNADPRIATDWNTVPMNYTLFAVKYINAYHGKYLHRGASIVKDKNGVTVDKVNYHQLYLEQNEVWSLQTMGRNQVGVDGVLRRSTGGVGPFSMILTFDENKNCSIVEKKLDVGVPVDQTIKNVALGKTAIASSLYTAAYVASNAVDGDSINNASRWLSGGGYPAWLEVDLGDTYSISGMRMLHASAGYGLTDFQFQAYYGGSWTDVVSVAGGYDIGNYNANFPEVKADKVRLNVTGAMKGSGSPVTRLYELKVFGKKFVPLPYTITGTGKFVNQGDEWGGKKRNTIYLDYTVLDPQSKETHNIKDTLVMRDRDVRIETFVPVIK